MDKIASDATLDNDQLRKVAAYGFGVALSTPSAGFAPDMVKVASDRFIAGLKKAADRHQALVNVIRGHLSAA